MKGKKSNVIVMSPWAKLFLDGISEYFSNSIVPRVNFLNYVKNIQVEAGKIIGIYEEKNGRQHNIELKFKILRDRERLMFSFFNSPSIINFLNDPAIQIEMNKCLLDENINIIPKWHDIDITCSCEYFDYLMPCRHVIGLFIKLLHEITNDSKILFKMQGVDILEVQQFVKNVHEIPDNILNFEEYSKKYQMIQKDVKLKNNNSTSIVEDKETNMNETNEIEEMSEKIIDEIENSDIETITEYGTIYKSRIGQTEFKKRLLAKYNKCLLCNINIHDLLIASHIKPWAESDNKERLDVNNGLLLCVLHDKLFDLGFISFSNDGTIIISSDIPENSYTELKIHKKLKIGVSKNMEKYINYHKENILR